MRQLSLRQKIGIGIGMALFFSLIGLAVYPSMWFLFVIVPFGIYFVWHGMKYGWRFGLAKIIHKEKYVSVLNDDQAKRKIIEYCENEDIIIQPTPPKYGTYDAKYEAGQRKIPIMIWKRFTSFSKRYFTWLLIICDMSTGTVTHRNIGDDFSDSDLDAFLEKWGGKIQYIERYTMPEQRGPVVERIVVREEKKEGE